MEIFEQLSHGSLLCGSTRIVGLTADVEPALVADAYRVGVVVHAVRADHPFRSSGLDRSVTTDHVVVTDAKVESPLAVPRIYLSDRTGLVRPHCRTMNNNQCYNPHDSSLLILHSSLFILHSLHAALHEECCNHQGYQRSRKLQDLTDLTSLKLKHLSIFNFNTAFFEHEFHKFHESIFLCSVNSFN